VTGAGAQPEVRVGDAVSVIDALAADVEGAARRVMAAGRSFAIAIPGGSVATRCFPRLATLSLDWTSVDFFWVDERAVPPSSPDSNYAAAQALWLAPAGVPAERVHRMRGEEADLERAARAYADELERVAGTPPRLDYVLLGVGPDGHVASLFPGHRSLLDERPVVVITDAPKPPPRRLSLSLATLVRAGRVAMVAFGREKAGVIREAVEDAASMLPAARLVRSAPACALILDREAASRL
jgi:6-phosphogluconolactonase